MLKLRKSQRVFWSHLHKITVPQLVNIMLKVKGQWYGLFFLMMERKRNSSWDSPSLSSFSIKYILLCCSKISNLKQLQFQFQSYECLIYIKSNPLDSNNGVPKTVFLLEFTKKCYLQCIRCNPQLQFPSTHITVVYCYGEMVFCLLLLKFVFSFFC